MVVPESRHVIAERGQKKVKVSSRIENRGGADLVIRGIETGCGCGVASLEREVIPPGEGATVTIEVTVPPGGERTLEVIARTDGVPDGTWPFRLTVVGDAPIPHVAWNTPVAQFGEIGEGTRSATISINTRERLGSEPWIRESDAGIPGLSIAGGFVGEQPSGAELVYRTYSYTLTFDEIPRPGNVVGRVAFRDGSGGPITLREIPILGVVRPLVSAVPPALDVSLDPGIEPTALRVHLERADSGGASRATAEEMGEGVVVEQVDAVEGPPTFLVRPVDTLRRRMGRLAFRTDVAGAGRVEVPYLFRIRGVEEGRSGGSE